MWSAGNPHIFLGFPKNSGPALAFLPLTYGVQTKFYCTKFLDAQLSEQPTMKRMICYIASFGISTLIATPYAAARDPFVTALLPCLEQFQEAPTDSRYQIVLDQGWTATLFAIAEKDGGGLGTDLCGKLDGGAMEFAAAYTWPENLGAPKAVTQSLVSPTWLDTVIRNARANGGTGAPVQRVSITALAQPNSHLVRVQFASAEADTKGIASVDLDADGVVIKHDTRVPDQFPRKAEANRAPEAVAEAVAPPSADPRQALSILLAATQAKPDAKVVRLVLSSFSAEIDYRNGANSDIRQTQFNYMDAQASTATDELFEFPTAFKECAMTLEQAKNAVAKVALQKRFSAVSKRLQHLILECSEENPKPRWLLTALEPFEYFYLPAE